MLVSLRRLASVGIALLLAPLGHADSLSVASGTLEVATGTLTIPDTTDVDSTLEINTGTVDANGTFDATGGSVTFTGAGRLQLGGSVTSIGTFTRSTGTVEYDDTSAGQSVVSTTYYNLEIDNSARVALTGGDVTVDNTLTVTSGELEVDDADTLQADGTSSISGTLHLEPAAVLQLANAQSFTVNSGGRFEAIGTATDLALVTSTGANRYSFSVAAGGIIEVDYAYFRHMDANGIQVTDNGSVQALAQFDNAVFSDGTTGGTFLKVTNNDNAVTLDHVLFDQSPAGISSNISTVNATAAITVDPYGGDWGGPSNEDDNGSGTVTPGFIVWATATPVQLRDFSATWDPGGVALAWDTAAEWNSRGFRIRRRTVDPTGVGPEVSIGSFVPAEGVSPDGERYRRLDPTVRTRDDYIYFLYEIDNRGGEAFIARARVEDPPAVAARSSALPSPPSRLPAPTSGARSASSGTTALTVSQPGPVYILVEHSGLIGVSYQALADASFEVTADPRSFRLLHGDTAWPIEIVGGQDGSFDPGDSIRFVAARFSNLESRFDGYRLEATGAGGALRISEFYGAPYRIPRETHASLIEQPLEEDNIYVASLAEGEDRDHWFWGSVSAGNTYEISTTLDSVEPREAKLELTLEGWTEDRIESTDHRIVISVNSMIVGEMVSNGRGPIRQKFTIPSGVLVDGDNEIGLSNVSGTQSTVFLGSASLTYARRSHARNDRVRFSTSDASSIKLDQFQDSDILVYQVDGDRAPRRVSGGVVLREQSGWSVSFEATAGKKNHYEAYTPATLPSPYAVEPARTDIVDPPAGASTIYIVPHALRESIEPLAEYRRSLGRSVEIVTLESIYQRFDHGRPTTIAIRRFLEHAYTQWPLPAVESVLLIGDATYDPCGNQGPSERQVLPTRLIETPEFQTASDNWFVDVEGDDGAPEIAIGRLPVANEIECAQVVAKIIRYEGMTRRRRSSKRALVVSDGGAEFSQARVAAEMQLGRLFTVDSLDLNDPSLVDPQQSLREEWTRGAAFVHYTGHGSRRDWSDQSILQADDIPLIQNGGSVPIVVAMNCLNGYFQSTTSPSLGEALLLSPGGAVAYWGPSSVTTRLRHEVLASALYSEFMRGARTLGEATRRAKTRVAGLPRSRIVLDTWILLGDPDLTLP